MKYFIHLVICLLFTTAIHQAAAQKSLLQSGPMLGYTDMLESMLWVQTKSVAKVQVAYWEQGTDNDKKFTEAVTTHKKDGYTAHLVADQVKPGKVYDYQLLINDVPVSFDYPTTFQTQTLWQWRTDPPPFKVALGSCFYVKRA